MAITVVKRPQGYIVDTNAVTATVTSSSGALFTKVAHGLSTGAFIYIYSNLSAYNGYWYVSVVSSSTFRIREYATASDQSFINSGSVTYYVSVLTHGWNCAHLPILYKLKSDLWPVNGVDTSRTITTFTNWNGYTYLVVNGDIKSSGVAASLDSVVLTGVTGVGGATITGVYKIVQWFSETNFVIDLAYDAGNVLSGGTCQYYYLNYHAKVRIYAGLASSHYWNAQKPYVLIGEEKVVFDSTGIGILNISEYVKSKLEVSNNNTIKDTLPNNLDAFCQFYISVSESYDDSDGYSVTEVTPSYTNDSFEGYALNAKLPFKTQSAGTLDDYVSGVTSLTRQKFLTPFDRPTIFSGKYFDISYINNSSASGQYMKVDRYLDGVLLSSTLDTIPDRDQGVYRYEVSVVSTEDRIDLTLFSTDYGYALQLSETKTIDVFQQCSQQDFYLTWLNYLGGYDYWNFNTKKVYGLTIEENKTQEINTFENYPSSYGEFADSITKQTLRTSRDLVNVTSQNISITQRDALKRIASSLLVQLCTSKYDRRTVLVSSSNVGGGRDREKKSNISLSISYTDEYPTQS